MSQRDIHQSARPFLLPGTSDRGILLIHGFTSSPYHFRKAAEFFHLRDYTVSAPLLPGHGTHPRHLNHVHRKDWYVAINGALRALVRRTPRITVVGDSFGGILAFILAALSEDRGHIDRVISVNAPVRIQGNIHRHFMPLLKFIHPLHRKPWARHLQKDHAITEEGVYTSYPLHALDQMYKAVRYDCLPNLHNVSAAALIVQGKKDERVHPDSAKDLYEKLGSDVKKIYWQTNGDHHPFKAAQQGFFHTLYRFMERDIS